MIPDLVHQIWLGPNKQEITELQANLKQSQPSCDYKIWGDADAENFRSAYFNGPLSETELWKRSTSPAMKSDIFRYLVLEKFGGYYFDSDFITHREISEIYQDANLILAAESMWFTNSIMGCKKKHELLTQLNTEIWQNDRALRMIKKGHSVLDITGPIFLTRTVVKLDSHVNPKTRIIPSSFFVMEPGYDIKWMRKVRPEVLDSEGFPIASIGRHLYNGSWTPISNEEVTSFSFRLKIFQLKRLLRIRTRIRKFMIG
jgi:mannosyltransferase OCH1-like enzyme